ncbi:MAG: endonuclease III [Candidatus Pacearchaeota archaeon]
MKAINQLKELKKLGGNMRLAGEKWQNKFQTLIAIILSARSLDETTIKYSKILFKKYPNAKKLSKASITDVQKIIKPINFYKNKSKNIINCAKILEEKYNGIPPLNFEKLKGLPGVGRKTANVFLSEYGKEAIAVDTHVFYISKYLGWTKAKNPENAEFDLKKLFPKKLWKDVNPILVKFGKKYTSKKEKNKVLDNVKRISFFLFIFFDFLFL